MTSPTARKELAPLHVTLRDLRRLSNPVPGSLRPAKIIHNVVSRSFLQMPWEMNVVQQSVHVQEHHISTVAVVAEGCGKAFHYVLAEVCVSERKRGRERFHPFSQTGL